MRRRKLEILKWRGSQQIAGYIAQLTHAINTCEDGAYVQIDLRTANCLVEICKQAQHTERQQENIMDL